MSNADKDAPQVSVIIPTACDRRRQLQIERAVNSVLTQRGPAVELLLVVNGERVDEGLFQRLLERDARVIRLAEGNVSKARFAGLQAARGRFFSFLDDDDEFLPGALDHRLALFSDGVDVVVTNGWARDARGDHPAVPPEVASLAGRDPARAFLRQNWFASAGSMFRRETLDLSLFDIEHRYFEWTLLFFLLVAAGRHMRYDDAKTYRVWKDSPQSASGSIEYALAHADLLGELVRLALPDDVVTQLRYKHQAALNRRCQLHLAHGQRLDAWRAHLSCLRAGGWRYLAFTRKLLV